MNTSINLNIFLWFCHKSSFASDHLNVFWWCCDIFFMRYFHFGAIKMFSFRRMPSEMLNNSQVDVKKDFFLIEWDILISFFSFSTNLNIKFVNSVVLFNSSSICRIQRWLWVGNDFDHQTFWIDHVNRRKNLRNVYSN